MDEAKLDALVLRSGQNFTYLSGVVYPGTLQRHMDLTDSTRPVLLVWPRNGKPVIVTNKTAAGLVERDGKRYAYRLTTKGINVALLFLFFHKRLCGPLANSRFHRRPDAEHRPNSKLEAAYHKADRAIEEVVRLLAA